MFLGIIKRNRNNKQKLKLFFFNFGERFHAKIVENHICFQISFPQGPTAEICNWKRALI
jgi:hypothetical protein